MRIFLPTITVCLVLTQGRGQADKIVSDEKNDNVDYEKEKSNRLGVNERRAYEEHSDEMWHISHLKNMGFESRRSHCKGESFDDKVKKYKKSSKNDGARVEFVSADALPVDENDLKSEKCDELPNDEIKVKDSQTNPTNTKVTVSAKDVKIKQISEAKPEVVNSATTNPENATVNGTKVDVDDKGRRAGDYLFSSVEYYDEVVDFDANICPDAVKVITLEEELIGKYDVECELMLEWRSMD